MPWNEECPQPFSLFPLSDACWLAPGSEARIVTRALFEPGELVRAPKAASVPSDVARWGVNGFAHFCRNKSGSDAEPRLGIIGYRLGKIGYLVNNLSVDNLERFLATQSMVDVGYHSIG